MKYLKSHNEGNKYRPTLGEFLIGLNNELKHEGFAIEMGHNSVGCDLSDVKDFNFYLRRKYESNININDINDSNSCYMSFYLPGFTISDLRKECNSNLDDDKSKWKCTNDEKDNFDRLSTSILVFLDEKEYDEYSNFKRYKIFRIFESYSIEEFVDELTNELGFYNLSPVQIRDLIDKLDLNDYIENGVSPKSVVDELNKDMEFGSGGYSSCYFNSPKQSTIKYL